MTRRYRVSLGVDASKSVIYSLLKVLSLATIGVMFPRAEGTVNQTGPIPPAILGRMFACMNGLWR